MADANGADRQRTLDPAACGRGPAEGGCVCRRAVTRAYRGLTAAGLPECKALDAAVRVYRYHHPEEPADRVRDLVESWMFTGPLH